MTDIKIPDDWTPEQATAVFEFIDDLRESIVIQYQLQIMEQLRSERCEDAEGIDLFEEREVPF